MDIERGCSLLMLLIWHLSPFSTAKHVLSLSMKNPVLTGGTKGSMAVVSSLNIQGGAKGNTIFGTRGVLGALGLELPIEGGGVGQEMTPSILSGLRSGPKIGLAGSSSQRTCPWSSSCVLSLRNRVVLAVLISSIKA